jgi:hypothetical protein
VARKRKMIQPDDYFSWGPLQMARFGKNIVFQTNWPDGAFDEMQHELIKRFPEVVKNIDDVVSKIADLVRTLPPEKILQRAWGEMAVRHLGMDSESDADTDDIISIRMVDYLQSVIVAIKPDDALRDEITEEDWQILRSLVKELFNQLNLDYQICRTAVKRKANPDFDLEYEGLYCKLERFWCNIRGQRYLYHEEEYFTDLISPHSDILNSLFGITAEQLIDEILKIQHALTRGIIEAGLELKEFQRVTMDALRPRLEGKEELTQGSLRDLMAEVISDNGWEQWQADLFGRLFGLDLFDLEKVTKIPRLLLEELSWGQGQDTDFFSDGEFKGWPLRIWPVFKRPFVKLNGRYYCFDLYSLLDNFYRVLQKKVIVLNEAYRVDWNQKQKEVSELLPFKYLQKLLPSAQVYHSVYYRWHTGCSGNKQWCEVDGLLIYDDHLFIIEVKAGAFTYTSPANDFPAYMESIKNLVLKPAVQGKRFVEYLKSDETVTIFNKNHNQIGELSSADFRQITICPITLDTFTELAAQVQNLKVLGIDVGSFPVWSISIDDLRVYSDIFDNPLIFLHFVEQRMKAFGSDILHTDDELDHVGLYVKHNVYSQYAKEMLVDTGTQLNFIGYRSDIDKFFTEKLHEPSTLSPLKQEMPNRLVEIINVLSMCGKLGRARIASYLLDCGDSWRNNITDGIEKILANQKAQIRLLPLSTYGDIKLTIFCWQEPFLPRNKELAIDHSRAAMLVAGDKERLMLELLYTDEGKLEDISWDNVTLADISNSDMERLMSIAATLKNRRLAKAGNIGRNDPCPCGSGKKYKKCCLQ